MRRVVAVEPVSKFSNARERFILILDARTRVENGQGCFIVASATSKGSVTVNARLVNIRSSAMRAPSFSSAKVAVMACGIRNVLNVFIVEQISRAHQVLI